MPKPWRHRQPVNRKPTRSREDKLKKIIAPLVLVLLLIVAAWFGTASLGMTTLFGVVIPYLAFAIFLLGFVWKILSWSKSPVPFRIPTTTGQQKTLNWIKHSELEAPSGLGGVTGRMLLEVLFFRSLFRNTKASLVEGPRLTYVSDKSLWLAGLIFHWSFLIIFLRHYRIFSEKIPFFVPILEAVDGFFEIVWYNPVHAITLPGLYLTDGLILLAITFLFLRRVFDTKVRYISLLQDYFPLYLIMGIVISGSLMRYNTKIDVIAAKSLVQSLVNFQPDLSLTVGPLFYVHLFLVSILALYFPFSKLMHAGGVFMSPTRNLANNSRAKRHINPWNPEIKIRTYADYEDDYREKMKAVDLPVEKE